MAERRGKKRAVRKTQPMSAVAARRAVSVGKKLADEVLQFRDASLRRRKAVVSTAARARHADAASATVASRLVRAAGGPEGLGVLVAEGDSWFDYPWHDVLRMLEDRHGYDVESVSHKGDRVEDMAYSGGQLEELTRLLEKLLRRSVIPTAILISGGGNDVAGEEFGILLDHSRSVTKGLNDDIVRGVLDRIRNAYLTILAAVTEVCRRRLGSVIPIVIHGYDRPVPDGRGFLGGWGPLPGPWLEPGFRQKGFTDLEETTRIAADLIGRFNKMLGSVVATPGFGHVRYLDLQSTLSNGPSYRTWWANELHPTERGFAAVADRFKAVLKDL